MGLRQLAWKERQSNRLFAVDGTCDPVRTTPGQRWASQATGPFSVGRLSLWFRGSQPQPARGFAVPRAAQLYSHLRRATMTAHRRTRSWRSRHIPPEPSSARDTDQPLAAAVPAGAESGLNEGVGLRAVRMFSFGSQRRPNANALQASAEANCGNRAKRHPREAAPVLTGNRGVVGDFNRSRPVGTSPRWCPAAGKEACELVLR